MNQLATKIATEYVATHNSIIKLLQAEFIKVGARMWRMDDAHKLYPKSTGFIARRITQAARIFPEGSDPVVVEFGSKEHTEWIREAYWSPAVMPLTVMDSYPHVTWEQREQVAKACKKIVDSTNECWRIRLNEILEGK